jgi:Rha family phage regulatory protein
MSDTVNLPVITLKSSIPVTNSRDVAAFFGKRHANILQSLDALECSPEFRQLNFQSATYLDAQDKPRPSIDMTKDGFVFLVMGFTGRKAAAFKEAYIARFNEMEGELRAQAVRAATTSAARLHRSLTGAAPLHRQLSPTYSPNPYPRFRWYRVSFRGFLYVPI